jgi:hypothetical protein
MSDRLAEDARIFLLTRLMDWAASFCRVLGRGLPCSASSL